MDDDMRNGIDKDGRLDPQSSVAPKYTPVASRFNDSVESKDELDMTQEELTMLHGLAERIKTMACEGGQIMEILEAANDIQLIGNQYIEEDEEDVGGEFQQVFTTVNGISTPVGELSYAAVAKWDGEMLAKLREVGLKDIG